MSAWATPVLQKGLAIVDDDDQLHLNFRGMTYYLHHVLLSLLPIVNKGHSASYRNHKTLTNLLLHTRLLTATFSQIETYKYTQRCSKVIHQPKCTCTDSFAVASSNPLPNQHCAEFLCRVLGVLATIYNGAQKCCCRLPGIVPKRQMLQTSAWANRGVGRLRHHRYDPHVRRYVRSGEIFQRRHL